MKNFFKMLKIVFAFLMVTLLISYFWYLLDVTSGAKGMTGSSYTDFVIYLLGYGDVDLMHPGLRPVFTILSLLSLTLLLSVFTVGLFEWKSKIYLCDKLLITKKKDEQYSAVLFLQSANREIYNVDIKLISSDKRKSISDEIEIPYLNKKTSRLVEFDIAPGTVLFNYLRSKKKQEEAVLIATISYTDISAGQEYNVCQKYLFENGGGDVSFSSSDLENKLMGKSEFLALAKKNDENMMEEVLGFVSADSFAISPALGNPINDNSIKIIKENENIRCIIDFKEINGRHDDFAMLCLNEPLGGNWYSYYDLGCEFEFDIAVEEGMAVTLEVKKPEGIKLIDRRFDGQGAERVIHYSYALKNLPREQWYYIKEVCFTVFYDSFSSENKSGSFKIENCRLKVKE